MTCDICKTVRCTPSASHNEDYFKYSVITMLCKIYEHGEQYAGQTCYDNGTPEQGIAIRILVLTNQVVTSVRYIDAITAVDVTDLVQSCTTCCDV